MATVSGAFGEEPRIEVEEDAGIGDEVIVEVLEQGEGPEVAEGDFLRLGVLARTLGDDEEEDPELVNSWRVEEPPAETGQEDEDTSGEDGEDTAEDSGEEGSEDAEDAEDAAEDTEEEAEEPSPAYLATQVGPTAQLPQESIDLLVGQKEGSRVVIEGPAEELLGGTAAQLGLGEDTGILWVFDIVTVIDAQGTAEGEQASPEEGMPTVEAEGTEPASITIPEGEDAPEELREQVLIEGDGPEVKAGQNLIAQYTGVSWEDGEKFDSSWDRDEAAMFGIGMGQVIEGWDEALVGKNVGSRVLLVIPPDMAYGAAPDHELGESTLVFVIDILEAI
ncbi:FKBP-type peptidyl-prolyl cis-trans isomerase [Streptomyces sodiiphilus]|uniref:FKBP-type peptidyl-prolyl cis-trans isomerase n=1 Tax=Streptomyces sodiiphilus TaxID=226217 RepID=UPI0031CF2804